MQVFSIHPQSPQDRLIDKVVTLLQQGKVVVYPTDSGYALGCVLGDKTALDRIRTIRQLDAKHNMTLMCRDLSDIGVYAQVDNTHYRLLKQFTPGSYTFVLKATREVPKRLLHPKRKTVGVRVPNHPIALALLAALGSPMMSVSMIMPHADDPLFDPDDIREQLNTQIDCLVDGGYCNQGATSVVDLSQPNVHVIREGTGDVSYFQ